LHRTQGWGTRGFGRGGLSAERGSAGQTGRLSLHGPSTLLRAGSRYTGICLSAGGPGLKPLFFLRPCAALKGRSTRLCTRHRRGVTGISHHSLRPAERVELPSGSSVVHKGMGSFASLRMTVHTRHSGRTCGVSMVKSRRGMEPLNPHPCAERTVGAPVGWGAPGFLPSGARVDRRGPLDFAQGRLAIHERLDFAQGRLALHGHLFLRGRAGAKAPFLFCVLTRP
jgi:hypothetical protein